MKKILFIVSFFFLLDASFNLEGKFTLNSQGIIVPINEINTDEKILIIEKDLLLGNYLLDYFKGQGFDQTFLAKFNSFSKDEINELFKKIRPDHVIVSGIESKDSSTYFSYPVNAISEYNLFFNYVLSASYNYGVTKMLVIVEDVVSENVNILDDLSSLKKLNYLNLFKLCEAYNFQNLTLFIPCIVSLIYSDNIDENFSGNKILKNIAKTIEIAKKKNKNELFFNMNSQNSYDFLHIDDLAKSSLFILKNYNHRNEINIATGLNYSVLDIINLLMHEVYRYGLKINFNDNLPVISKYISPYAIHNMGLYPRSNYLFNSLKKIKVN
jgi:GDP-L-fucose synthase